jgi:hypothetical protein
VTRFQGGEFVFRLLFIMQGAGAFTLAFGRLEAARVVDAHCALGDGHNAEIGSVAAATLDGIGDLLDVVGNLRD